MTHKPKDYIAKSGAYLITCVATGERYVGGSVDMSRRLDSHFSALKHGTHSNPRLQDRYDRHGRTAFACKYLERCQAEDVLAVEQKWLDLLRPELNEYQQANPVGRKASESVLSNMRAARPSLIGNQHSKGATRSPETRAKIAASRKGKASKLRGRPLSAEHKAKISATKRLLAGSGHVDCDCMSCRPP